MIRVLLICAAIHTGAAFAQTPGTFASAGTMTTPRAVHSATLLPDGRVLISGGSGNAGTTPTPQNSAEIYDPSLNMFTATSWDGGGGYRPTRLLPDGNVLVFGVNGPGFYNPVTGIFRVRRWHNRPSRYPAEQRHGVHPLRSGRTTLRSRHRREYRDGRLRH
jgi:hypothetical protein